MKTSLAEFKQYIAQLEEIDSIVIDIQKAEGIYIWDTDNKEYIDMLSGICVANVGHRNPKVVAAVKEQLDKYMHVMVYGEARQAPQLNYAKRLMSLLPDNFQQIFYVNSGSEAIEGAIKTARIYNGREEIISFNNSYHGSTLGAVSMISGEEYTRKFRPLIPMCNQIEYNNEKDLEKITQRTCCVVAESVQAGGGVVLPKNDFLKKLRERCTQTGTLLIMDEIQTGFGRTGLLFGFQHYGIVPDILCIAKSMGAGLPIGAFLSSYKIMNKLNNHHPLIGHATTFGGNALCLVSALASLDTLINDHIIEDVERKGKIYRQFSHPLIKEMRGVGLFNCMQLYDDVDWQKVLVSCFEEGVITGTHLFATQCFCIKPPLIITDVQIEESLCRIKRALSRV
jgi:Ornithine/acetylornithine aminotransferase